MKRTIILVIILNLIPALRCQFLDCHDDPTDDPDDGPLDDMAYTWLGTLQYIHVSNGTPHYFRVPRVVLVSRQFVLSTAVDAAQIPDGYALGNVAFGEYERDEYECGLTVTDLARGTPCDPAALVVPLADVLLHPEYKHFGLSDSIALLKLLTPVKSVYMLPACLPYANYVTTRSGRPSKEILFHIDFSSEVPRDIIEEEKEVTKVNILPKELCYLYDNKIVNVNQNRTNLPKKRLMCTTGCGFFSGSPTLVHEKTGHWSIVGIALGGSPCPDPMRGRAPPPPQRHIVIQPYVPWITAAITGRAIGAFDKEDPFGYSNQHQRASIFDLLGHEWSGHWWMGGIRCFDRGEVARDLFKFYHEVLSVRPHEEAFMDYYLELYSTDAVTIICVKVGMPYRLSKPKVWHLDSPDVKVRIPMIRFWHTYALQVEAWGYNTTESSASSSSSSSSSTPESSSASCTVPPCR